MLSPVPWRELPRALLVALTLKILSLLILYAGWHLVDRAVYRDEMGRRVDLWMTRPETSFADNLANFDGAWFVRIAMLGYRRLAEGSYDCAAERARLRVLDQLGCEQARWPKETPDRFDRGYGFRHFPFWPGLIRGAARLGLDPVHAAVGMANLFTVIYGVLLYLLARLDLNPGRATLAVVFSQFHPGAFALSGGYNEPLFLALAAGAMLAARTGRWPAAGLLVMAAVMTRIFGVVLAAPLFWEWLNQQTEKAERERGRRPILSLATLRLAGRALLAAPGVWWLMLVPGGFLVVLAIFYQAAGDPLVWMKVHEANVYGHVNWPWLMMLETWRKGWVIAAKELPLHAFLLLVLIASAGRVRGAYWLWMLLFFLHHTTNANHSYLRYQIECLPLFLSLATLTAGRLWLWAPLSAAFFLLFVFFGVMFINGYWVA